METVRFLLGSDPELFLRDPETKELRSAIPVIAEGKMAPRPLATGGAVLHDNVLIEFNTIPADTPEKFTAIIGTALKEISSLAAAKNTELLLQASANFPNSQLQGYEASAFGCDPDFDAYALAINHVPADAAHKPFRSAGGHLHIGAHKEDKELAELLLDESGLGKVRVVKALDIFVGLMSVFLDKDVTAAARRGLYGKAGAHRPKTYGVEYRACSSWWLATPEHTHLIYDLSAKALAVALDEELFVELIEDLGGAEELQRVINESDIATARKLYEEHLHPLLDEELHNRIEQVDTMPAAELSQAWEF